MTGIEAIVEMMNRKGLHLFVDEAGNLMCSGQPGPNTLALLRKNKPALIAHLTPRWVPASTTRAALDAARQVGYWPASFSLHHPTRGRVDYPEPALLLDHTLDAQGIDLPTVPVLGPGPVVVAGVVEVALVENVLLLWTPFNQDFVDDLKLVCGSRLPKGKDEWRTVTPTGCRWDSVMKCWVVASHYSWGLTDVILAHYRYDFQPAFDHLMG